LVEWWRKDSEGSGHEGAVTIIVVSNNISHFHLSVDIFHF